jgi:hypothetical protein
MFRNNSSDLKFRLIFIIAFFSIVLLGPEGNFNANAASEPYTSSGIYISYPNNDYNNQLIKNTGDQKNGSTGVSEAAEGYRCSSGGSSSTDYGLNRASIVGDLYDLSGTSGLTVYAWANSEYQDWLTISNPALTGEEGQAFFFHRLAGNATGRSGAGYSFVVESLPPYNYSLDSASEDVISANENKIFPFTFIYGASYKIKASLSVSVLASDMHPSGSSSFGNSAEIVKIEIPTGATLTALSGHKYPTNSSNYFIYLPIIIR